ncbi:MAG TPA: phage tail tape measure protein, partial [Acidimicrobiia bacterium]
MAVVVSFVGKWNGKDVQKAQREIDKFSGQSKKSLGGFAKKAGVALGAVGAAAGAAAVGVGVAAGKMAVNFDTAMTKIQSLVGLTGDEVDKMKGKVLELSGQTAKTPEELADGLFVVTSAGLRGEEAMKALEASAKAGAAGLGETNDIARSVAGAMSAYGSDVLSASAATDQIVATARAGNFETSQFAGALGRVLPFANQAGAGLDQVGGAVALLTRTNGDAAQSVTQMNALFKAFVTPTEEAKKALSDVGMSASDVRDAIAKDGLPAALDMLEEKMGGNREQLGKMLGSSEAASAAFQILDADSKTIADTFGVVGDAAGMTDEAFNTTAETTGFKLQEAFQEIKNSLLELGETLMPLIEMFAERITVVTDIFDKLTPVIEPLVGVLMEVGEILADILLDALDALIPALTPIIEIFGNLVRRIGPLLAKIIGKVADVLVKLLDVVVPLLEPLMELVFGILDAAWPVIETVIDVVLTLVEALSPLLDAVMLLLQPLGDLIELGLKAIMPVL